MKRVVKSATGPDTEYNVTIGFCGLIDYDTERTIDARVGADKDEILYIVQEDYADELLEAKVIDVDLDSDVYEVEVTFNSQFMCTEVYFVWANDEDEAIDEALERAKDDLEVIEFHEL